jgi:hypothetical protein
MPNVERAPEPAEREWLAKVLPIVRFRKDQRKSFQLSTVPTTLFALFEDALVVVMGPEVKPIPEECYSADGLERLLTWRLIGREHVWSLPTISSVTVEPPSVLDDKSKFTVIASGRKIQFDLPVDESPHVIRALRALLGDRLDLRERIHLRVNKTRFSIQLICVAVAVLQIVTAGVNWGLLLPLIPFGVLLVREALDRTPKRPEVRRKPAAKA